MSLLKKIKIEMKFFTQRKDEYNFFGRPIEYRSSGQAIVCCINWIFAFVGVLLFPIAQRVLGSYIFVLLVAFTAIGVIFTWAFQPETKGRTPQDMQLILNKSWFVLHKYNK